MTATETNTKWKRKTQTIKTKRNIKTKRKETETNKWTTKISVKQWATQDNHERLKKERNVNTDTGHGHWKENRQTTDYDENREPEHHEQKGNSNMGNIQTGER